MNHQPRTHETASGCDVCGERAASELYIAKDRLRNSDDDFIIAECAGCRVIRTLPEMTEDELAAFYTENYWGETGEPSQSWIESSQADKTKLFFQREAEGERILDVGCGSGFFLRALDSSKWERFGVDISEEAVRAAARALGEDHIFRGTLPEANFQDGFFDVITFWSALEHTNEPKANLIEARRIIKAGGTLIIQVPNIASYQARRFKGDWFALDAPRHRYHFTTDILSSLLSKTGFEVYRMVLYSKTHNAHALRQSLKSKLYTKPSPAYKKVLFRLSIPLIKPFDWMMSARGRGATITLVARAY